jgi:hypothetical protein
MNSKSHLRKRGWLLSLKRIKGDKPYFLVVSAATAAGFTAG